MSIDQAFFLGLLVAGVPFGVLWLRAAARRDLLAIKAAAYDDAFDHSQRMYERACEAYRQLDQWRETHAAWLAMAERLDAQDERPIVH